MNITDLPITRLTGASWNPNCMDSYMLSRLRESLERFGVVDNLVVRPLSDGLYETLSGNQRLQVMAEQGYTHAPCVIVDLDDIQAKLLAQALNRIGGEDDLGLKAELVREMLRSLPQSEILSLLPESAESLRALESLGTADISEQLQAWQQAQSARLRHMTFQLTTEQQQVVKEALDRALNVAPENDVNPNRNGTALFRLCQYYLASERSKSE